MTTRGLVARLDAAEGRELELEQLLIGARAIVEPEPGTISWFALRFGYGEYGIFDAFPDAKGRRAHLFGDIPKQLTLHGLPWLGGLRIMSFVDVLAQKL